MFVKECVECVFVFELYYMECECEDGCWISVEGFFLFDGGWVVVYIDIMNVKWQEELLCGRFEEFLEILFKYFEDLVSVNCKFESMVIVLEEVKWLVFDFEVCMCLIIEMMFVYIVYVGFDYCYIYLNRCFFLVMLG